MQSVYYVGLDVHKKTISYCVKDVSGNIHFQGAIAATRIDLNRWMKTLPQPWTAAVDRRQKDFLVIERQNQTAA